MTSWILEVEGALNREQRAVAEGLAAILERLKPPHLDVAGSSVVADTNGFHVTLSHSNRPELRVDVDASGGARTLCGMCDMAPYLVTGLVALKRRSWSSSRGVRELSVRGRPSG